MPSIFLDLAKNHKLKTIVSHEAISRAVDDIWNEGKTSTKSRWFNFTPKTLWILNFIFDTIYFVCLSVMMLTGMCVKALVLFHKYSVVIRTFFRFSILVDFDVLKWKINFRVLCDRIGRFRRQSDYSQNS